MSDCAVPMRTYEKPEPGECCPFCGSADLRVKPVWKTWRFVACNACKAGGPVRRTEAEAIQAFDTRAGDTGASAALVEQKRMFGQLAMVARRLYWQLVERSTWMTSEEWQVMCESGREMRELGIEIERR